MIISVSRRTDIPAFYGEWFANRLREKFALVRNPFNPKQLSRIDLSPEAIDGMVFWSKNPWPMRRLFEQLAADGMPFYLEYTLNAYESPLEPELPPLTQRVAAFAGLAAAVGRERLIWRYDPIAFSATYTPEYHQANFRMLAAKLSSCTGKCIVSFLDFYRKTKRNCAPYGLFDPEDKVKLDLAYRLGEIGSEVGLTLEACAEPLDLAAAGIGRAGCIDAGLLGRLGGGVLNVGRDRRQRPACGCAASVDIGGYDSCPHGCRYCYANSSPALACRNFQLHDPAAPSL
ncbi:MAG: DUF1848 domain-containing protein [Victivallaceae bacterium]